MDALWRERATGTEANARLTDEIGEALRALGYEVAELPFECCVWEHGPSALTVGGESVPIEPNPYSEGFEGVCGAVSADTADELSQADCAGKLLLLGGELAAEPLQPKDYPFYYPDEHRAIHELLERKAPAAILAGTGPDAMSGLDPFPLFDGGAFPIPSARVSRECLARVRGLLAGGASAVVRIASVKKPSRARQLVASQKGEGARVIVAAHMDAKNDSPGALDNGAGVAVLLAAAKALAGSDLRVDVVPFNSEEYFSAGGELAYLEHIAEDERPPRLMINIDSPCHRGAALAVSSYNLNDGMQNALEETLKRHPRVERGDEWYAGDHAMFVFQDVPCLALSSADLFTGALARTHTRDDTRDTVDESLIAPAAAFVAEVARAMARAQK